MNAVEIRLEDVRFYMRNVHTRMPFKYGAAVLTAVPILHVVAQGALKKRHSGTRGCSRYSAA